MCKLSYGWFSYGGPFNQWAPCIFYCAFVWSFIFCTSYYKVNKHTVGMQHLKGCFIDNISHTWEGLKVDGYIKPSHAYVFWWGYKESTSLAFTHIRICLLIKFQPPTRLLAPPGPVFVFWPQTKLPLWMVPFENKPPQSSNIEKICLWTKFQPPTWLLAPTGPVFAFRPLNKLPL